MKKAPVYIALILLLYTVGLYSAEISDAKDSTKVLEQAPKEKGFDLIAIGGLGFGWGGGRDTWGEHIEQYAPTVVLGVELPFTSAHKFALEVTTHIWFGKQRLDANTDEISKFYSNNYIKTGASTYTDIGISNVLKWYITKQTSKFRVGVHLGFLLSNFSKLSSNHHGSWDIGIAFSYPIYENLILSLSQRIFFEGIRFENADSGIAPNILSLNINYKFKL